MRDNWSVSSARVASARTHIHHKSKLAKKGDTDVSNDEQGAERRERPSRCLRSQKAVGPHLERKLAVRTSFTPEHPKFSSASRIAKSTSQVDYVNSRRANRSLVAAGLADENVNERMRTANQPQRFEGTHRGARTNNHKLLMETTSQKRKGADLSHLTLGCFASSKR